MITTELRTTTVEPDKIPLETGLQTVITKTPHEPLQKSNSPAAVDKSLEQFFLEQQLDGKDLVKGREILGKRAETLTDEELKVAITEIRFLVESWLDTFEREIFKGLTLQELLHERG